MFVRDLSGQEFSLFAPGYSGMGMSFIVLAPAVVFAALRVNKGIGTPEHTVNLEEFRQNVFVFVFYVPDIISCFCS